VRIGGVATGWASIADVCGATWQTTVSDLDGCDAPSGLVTVELLDGPRRGLFAIGDLEHPELIVDAHNPGAEVQVFGRSEFGPPLA
jgi:hypothetical protein